jgi:aryl-alcohol dehydrogenase-like predicted oxidoreductase
MFCIAWLRYTPVAVRVRRIDDTRAHARELGGTEDMQTRTFGASGVEASTVGFGVWTISTGWWGDVSDEQAKELLRAAFDAGITLFDTADTYGEGRGERLLAEALGDVRDQVTIATKFGYDIYSPWDRKGHQERPHDWSPTFARFALERSLERLRTDHVDVWQLHNPRMDALRSDALWEAIAQARDEGLVRAIGIALGPAIGWRDEGVFALEERPIDEAQIIHNLLEQDPGREFLEIANRQGVGVMVRVPHSSGLLEGRYTKDTEFAANDHRRHRPRRWLLEGVDKVERLRFLEEPGRTLGQAAIQWLLADPAVTCVLPNIYGREQLEEFAAAPSTPPLSDDELERVAALYARNFDVVPVEA